MPDSFYLCRVNNVFFPFLCFVLIVGCTDEQTENENPLIAHDAQHRMKVDHARFFQLDSLLDGYRLNIINPSNGYVEESWELSYDSDRKGDNVIHVPLKSLAVESATQIGMIGALDAFDHLGGVSTMQYVYDERAHNAFKKKSIIEIGNEHLMKTESAVKAGINGVLHSALNGDLPNRQKFEQLGIHCIRIYEWQEVHPLGRAEWIKVIGILIGKEKEANAHFEQCVTNYESIKTTLAAVKKKPSVMSGNFIADAWYTPAGDSYMATLIADAAGDYRYAHTEGTASLSLPMEQVIIDNTDTQFWINCGFATKTALLNGNPKANLLAPYANGLYCYSKQMNYFWEQSAVYPDHVLADLASIFHPKILDAHKLVFYSKIDS